MSTFEQACEEKFERGRKEHGDDWLKIDARFEMMQELTDLYNYASLTDWSGVELGGVENYKRRTIKLLATYHSKERGNPAIAKRT
jgi:hypothetical protein